MATRTRLWIGRALSAIAVLFLVFDASAKLMKVQPVLDASAQLGFAQNSIVAIGLLLLVCTSIYVIPGTQIFGAVLLTGYLGGAIAAQVRVGNPIFETIFPVIVGSIVWTGLALRDRRIRGLLGPAA